MGSRRQLIHVTAPWSSIGRIEGAKDYPPSRLRRIRGPLDRRLLSPGLPKFPKPGLNFFPTNQMISINGRAQSFCHRPVREPSGELFYGRCSD
jgi:hypothetical protein